MTFFKEIKQVYKDDRLSNVIKIFDELQTKYKLSDETLDALTNDILESGAFKARTATLPLLNDRRKVFCALYTLHDMAGESLKAKEDDKPKLGVKP